jgi:hypothetical protein
MRRVALLLFLCGCASSGNSGEAYTPKAAVIYAGDNSTNRLEADRPRSSVMTIAAPPATVWAAVKQVFASLEVPVSVELPAAHTLGNQNFYKTRQMAGQPMTDFVDCGPGQTGPKASSYRIYMSLLTDVSSDGKGGTLLQATFTALGQDISGISGDRITCGTTGRLEQLVLDRVKIAVALH